MNGRVDKNKSNNFNCFTTRDNIVVDYALLGHESFSLVNKLHIGELCELSDHSPIELSIKSSNNISISETKTDTSAVNRHTNDDNKLLQNCNKQFYVNGASALEILSSVMESSEVNNFLKDISNDLDNTDLSIEEIIELLRSKLIDLSEVYLSSRNIFGRTNNKNKFRLRNKCPWFDAECQEAKQLLNSKRKAYQAALKFSSYTRDNHVIALKSAYFEQRRVYKKIISYKLNSFLEIKRLELWNLRRGTPKDVWKKLRGRKEKPSLNFCNNQLLTYFSTLLNSEDTRDRDDNKHEILAPSMDTMRQNLIDQNLNRDIPLEEVTLMAKKLKSG